MTDGFTIYQSLINALEDLKYLNRLTKNEFIDLLFCDSVANYADNKWEAFCDNVLHFLWSCSSDKLIIICEYISSCKVV
jgi:hypothetical protein